MEGEEAVAFATVVFFEVAEVVCYAGADELAGGGVVELACHP